MYNMYVVWKYPRMKLYCAYFMNQYLWYLIYRQIDSVTFSTGGLGTYFK